MVAACATGKGKGMQEGSRTPWGRADYVERVADGVWTVGTPSHGGIKLDATRNALVPEHMRQAGGWYEEDCDWAIPVIALGIMSEHREAARETLRNWNPDAYERHYGESINPGESLMRDEAVFAELHKGDLVGISGYGSWADWVPEGKVGVCATRGGEYGNGDASWFLVDKARYESRGRHGYVIQADDERVTEPV